MHEPAAKGELFCLLLPGSGMGGSEKQALLLAKELKRRNYEVVVSCLDNGDRGLIIQLHQHGIEAKCLAIRAPKYFPQTLKKLLRQLLLLPNVVYLLLTLRPDNLISYCYYPNVIVGLLKPFFPRIFWVWNQRDGGLPGQSRWLARKVIHYANAYSANSSYSASFLTNILGVSPDKISIIRNAFTADLFCAPTSGSQFGKLLALAGQRRIACMVANLSKRKDHETVLRAWSHLDPALRDSWLLVLVGADDDNSSEVRNLITKLRILDSVHFHGAEPNVRSLLKLCHLGICSSYSEGSSNVILEYLSEGIPVLASDIPSTREIEVLTRANISFFPAGNVGKLVEIFNVELSSPSRRNRSSILSAFSIEKRTDEVLRMFNLT